MVIREILRSRRFLVPAAIATLAVLLTVLISVAGFFGERQRLRQRVRRLEQEKSAAEGSAAHWKADSKAKDQYLISVTSLLNDVGNRIEEIQQSQQGLASLTIQRSGDSFRVIKNKSIPAALDRIEAQLQKNQEQIVQLEALVDAKNAQSLAMKAVVERFKHQNEGLDEQLRALRLKFGALSKKVQKLEGQVGELVGVVSEKDKVIGEKDKEIGAKETELIEKSQRLDAAETDKWTRHYAVGTRKELCGLSLVTPCGFFKSIVTPRLADRHVDAFEECGERCQSVDARSIQEIPVGKSNGRIEILPPRLTSSYVIERRSGGLYLVIRDRDEFWKARYLVVLVDR